MNRKLLLLLGIGLLVSACSLPAGFGLTGETAVPSPTLTPPPAPILVDTPYPTPVFTPEPTPGPIARIESGDWAYQIGNWTEALRAYQSALQTESQPDLQTAALLGIGRVYYQQRNYAAALDTLRTLIDAYPTSPHLPAAHIVLAQTFEALARDGEAAQAYAAFLALRPGLLDSYVEEWRGDALFAAGEYLPAIDAYQQAMAASRLDQPFNVQIKIADTYMALGDYPTALIAYQDVYTNTNNDYTKAQANYRIGRAWLAQGQPEQAYAAYLDAVENYPLAYDSYLALIELVEAGYPVSEFDRGIVDYFAGQYSLAIAAFDRYLVDGSENAGTAYYYKGMSLRAIDEPEAAIAAWEILIQSYPDDGRWREAWEQKAYTLWAYLDQYEQASQTFLDFVRAKPFDSLAPEYLYYAARIAERQGELLRAAEIWERIPPEYPASSYVAAAIFQAGIAHYRLGDYNTALLRFEQLQGSSGDLEDKAAARLWIGKCHQALADPLKAQAAWQLAANTDPTGYYSERARDLLLERPPFTPPVQYDLAVDWQTEQELAEDWMRAAFAIPAGVDLSGPGPLAYDERFMRGTALWDLGFDELARSEFEALRLDVSSNPMDSYRLANHLYDLGLYRSAIFAARQVLNLADMDDAATLSAPAYFNYLRFGSYYRALVLPVAQEYGFHPLFLFSVIRQESLFEGFVRSSAGARGLMQIMPATGQSIVDRRGWPPDYSAEDLYRPWVNVNLGADYLAAQRDYFGGDYYPALAAYNGGPGNADVWYGLAQGDPDLFVEVVRFEETRNYIRGIYEVFAIYRGLYDRSP